jgi:uncharacterized protein YlaI
MAFEYRKSKCDSYCRICDRMNLKDEDMVIYSYSIRNRGQNILICPQCVKNMYSEIMLRDDENAI